MNPEDSKLGDPKPEQISSAKPRTNAKSFWALYRKELGTMFNSAIAYVFIIVFLLISSLLATQFIFESMRAEMRYYFWLMPIILPIFISAVTMRTWAEEKRQGTIELLMTLPVSLWSLVFSKYLACLTFFLVALIASVGIPTMLLLVWKADPGPVFTGYIGVAAMGAFFIAMGMYISAHTRDQIVAFILSLVACFLFVLIGLPFINEWLCGLIGGGVLCALFIAMGLYALVIGRDTIGGVIQLLLGCAVLGFMGLSFFTEGFSSWIKGTGNFLRTQVAVQEHLEPFEKGILSLSDMIYFAAISGLFICINMFALASYVNVKDQERYSLAGMLIILICVFTALNANESRIGRIDLTEGKVHTVSDSSKRILSRLAGPVYVTYYVTNAEKIPREWKQLERDVTDLLRELSVASPNFHYKIEDAAESQSKLREKGIEAQPVGSGNREEAHLNLVTSAIEINYHNKPEEVIHWISPAELPSLEYEVLSRIHRLTIERKPKIALFSKIEDVNPFMMQMGRGPKDEYRDVTSIFTQQGYDIVRTKITAAENIPSDADALVVLGPDKINDRQLYEINKFIRSGRPAFIAVQNYSLDYGSFRTTQTVPIIKAEHQLDILLNTWGVNAEKSVLMDAEFIQERLPMDTIIGGKNINTDTAIMNGLRGLIYTWGSHLKLDQEKLKINSLKHKIMVTSGDSSWSVPMTYGRIAIKDMTADLAKPMGNQPLVILMEGTFPDAFAGKPVPPWPQAGPPDLKPLNKAEPTRVIITGCSQMFTNGWLGPSDKANGSFILNSLDLLTHAEDVANIRTKQAGAKLLGSVSPKDGLLYRLVMIAMMPLLIIIAGIIKLIIRRTGRQSYQKEFSRS